MIKGVGNQVVNAQVYTTNGSDFTGTVTVYVTIDQQPQTLGVGTCTLKGSGQYQYIANATETNGDLIGFQFRGTGALTVTIDIATVTAAQTTALTGATATGQSITLVSDLLTVALKRINVVQAGGTAEGSDLKDAFDFANLWLDSMANERLIIPFVARPTFSLTTTKGTPTNPYTVGTSGDINIAKPLFLDRLNFYDTSVSPVNELPLSKLTDMGYQSLVQKTMTATYPVFWYYSATYAAGFGSLYLNPIPTSGTLVGALYAPSTIQQFTSLTQTIVLPPGYKFFIQENLAMFFASTFRENLPVDPELKASAMATKRNIKAANVPMVDLAMDSGALLGLGSHANIYTGQA